MQGLALAALARNPLFNERILLLLTEAEGGKDFAAVFSQPRGRQPDRAFGSAKPGCRSCLAHLTEARDLFALDDMTLSDLRMIKQLCPVE